MAASKPAAAEATCMADAFKVDAPVTMTAAVNPIAILRIMMLLLLFRGCTPQP